MKLTIQGVGSPEAIRQNERCARRLKFPRIVQKPIHGRCLALVGGGPSAAEHLEEIGAYDEVWAINEAAAWLKGKGISATLFTIDPSPMAPEAYDVDSAIFATSASAEGMRAMQGKDVRVFESRYGGPTSASRAPRIALMLGFGRVTFFGLEGSYRATTHAYKDENIGHMVVRCEGRYYRTHPEFFVQGQHLAECVRDHPKVFDERSGGLLGAMCRSGEWKVVAFSNSLLERKVS